MRLPSFLSLLRVCLPVVFVAASSLPTHAVFAQATLAAPPPSAFNHRNVIVIYKDQHIGISATSGARPSALSASQSPLIAKLQQSQARQVHSFKTLNAFATTVSAEEAEQIGKDPLVQAVVPDAVIRMKPSKSRLALEAGVIPSGSAKAQTPVNGTAGLCNTLEPEALQLTNAAFLNPATPQAQLQLDPNGHPIDGSGVKVAFLADALDITVPGFTRPDGSKVFIDYQNFSGDPVGTPNVGGAEAFGDASSIAAQDMPNGVPLLYDISQFSAMTLPSPCNIRIRGIAPGASLVGLDIFSATGFTTTSTFVDAIDYATYVDKVDVINESFGGNPYFDTTNDPISIANSMAVAAGITVVVSSGDAGTSGTLESPATDPYVISAGASTQFRFYAQTGNGILPLANGYVSNGISALSSGGFAQYKPRTVDVVAPGDLSWALCSTNVTIYSDCLTYFSAPTPIESFGGTSEASPLTAGEAALVIQAYRSTHNNITPSPALVKSIIMSTATNLDAPSDEQGAGLINALSAVQTAFSVKDTNGTPTYHVGELLFDVTSQAITAPENTPETFQVKVTNTGLTTRTLAPRLQTLIPAGGASLTLNLNPATLPTFVTDNGFPRAYLEQTFTVAAGAQHLDASIAYQQQNANTLVWLGLLDPSGAQAAYSLPQGTGNGYAHVEVNKPTAGIWTAVLYTRLPSLSNASYTGPVAFTWATQHYYLVAMPSPTQFTLAPGATQTITTNFNMPAQPGDFAGILRFDQGAEQTSMVEPSIPVEVRTLVPIGSTGGDFTGTLTGGNARAGASPTQTFQFDVPAGAAALSLALKNTDNSYALQGFLVDPHGMTLSSQLNQDPYYYGVTYPGLQLYHENPEAGRWSFVLGLASQSSGKQTSLPFSAHIDLRTIPFTAPGLPNSPTVLLSASATPVYVPVTVTNTSALTQVFYTDARQTINQYYSYPVNTCGPGICFDFAVPPETREIDTFVYAASPIEAELTYGYNSPDILGYSIGTNAAAATLRSPEVPWGYWFSIVNSVGPYGPSGETSPAINNFYAYLYLKPEDLAMYPVNGNPYDDLNFYTGTFNPLVLAPGASGVLPVYIYPDPTLLGQTVNGFLYVDTFSYVTYTGDEVIKIPYSYTVAP